MKRLILWLAAALFIATLLTMALAFWQPAWLRRAVLESAEDAVNRTTPYHLTVQGLRFSVLRGLRLREVQVNTKADGREIFRADSIDVAVEWLPLVRLREVRLTRVVLVRPNLSLALDDPTLRAGRSKGAMAPPSIQRLAIEDGAIKIRAHLRDPKREIILNRIKLSAALNAEGLVVLRQLTFTLNGGSADIQGRGSLRPRPKAELSLNTHQLPLQDLIMLFRPGLPSLFLPLSAKLTLAGSSDQVTGTITGNLAQAPIRASAIWHATGWYRAQLSWSEAQIDQLWPSAPITRVRLSGALSATGRGSSPTVDGNMALIRAGEGGKPAEELKAALHWMKGKGPIDLRGRYGSLSGKASAIVDLPMRVASGDFRLSVSSFGALGPEFLPARGWAEAHGQFSWRPAAWMVQGKAAGRDMGWKAKSARAASVDFKVDSVNSDLHLRASDIEPNGSAQDPLAIKTLDFQAQGPRQIQRMALKLNFQSGASFDLSGELAKKPARYEFTTERFILGIPSGGTWQTNVPANIVYDAQGRLACHELALNQGTQSIAIRKLEWSRHESSVDLNVHLDPSAFNALSPATEFAKGSLLDFQWRAQSSGQVMHADGSLSATADRVLIIPVGLALRHFACHVHSTDSLFDVDACSAETAHGRVVLSGHSALPALQLVLHGTKLDFERKKLFKGSGSIDLDLGGTLPSPELKGNIAVSEAIYNAPKKTKSAPAPSPGMAAPRARSAVLWRASLLDVTMKWPRNVWYRDGASSIETRADLRVQKAHGEDNARFTGSITSVRGNYSYLGRSFNIDSAQLQFPGTPGFDPLLNVQASYPAEAIVVYLNVTGTVTQPVLALRSSPPLSDQDIVSVIAFGQPISSLRSTGGANTNQQMEAAAGSVLGSLVTTQLRDTGITPLEFDVFDVQPTSQGSQLTVGRYLTRKLYVSYGQTLANNPNKAFDADYFLKDWLMLEGETGTASGNHLDLLFRLPLNGSRDSGSSVLRSPFRNSLDPTTGVGVPVAPRTP